MKPWNMATQTDKIKHIIIRPQGNHPHSQPMTNKSKLDKLNSIVAMLENVERREETTLTVSRKKNQQMALLLRDAQVEVTKLTKQETMKIIASYMMLQPDRNKVFL
jgi:general stress protein 26